VIFIIILQHADLGMEDAMANRYGLYKVFSPCAPRAMLAKACADAGDVRQDLNIPRASA
jgi:hypothetical protein